MVFRVLECGLELELIADSSLARRDVAPGGDVDFVKHVVVEVVYVRPDPRFLVRIDAERDDEGFLAACPRPRRRKRRWCWPRDRG